MATSNRPDTCANRLGTWLILASGCTLLAIMVYALTLGTGALSGKAARPSVEVAVYFPDRNSWRTFRQGVDLCVEQGLVEVHQQTADSILIRSKRSGRSIRFTWDGSLGIWEMMASLTRRLEGPNPPAAVIGSSNTALTAALARVISNHAAKSDFQAGPILLVPAATSIEIDDPAPIAESSKRIRLLDILPGRTFRVCLNNERLAQLCIDYVSQQQTGPPSEVFAISDGFDPCSADLARAFERIVMDRFPETEFREIDAGRSVESPSVPPTVAETELTHTIWTAAASATADRPLWVVLTTQGGPARRILGVLNSTAPAVPPAHIHVLCGDGLGQATLASFAGTLRFPVYGSASSSLGSWRPEQGLITGDAQIEAEAISALVAGLDDSAHDLAATLDRVSWRATDRAAMGRSLTFEDGDRVGADVGQVLEIRPHSDRVYGHIRTGPEHWLNLQWTAGGWRPEPTATHRR